MVYDFKVIIICNLYSLFAFISFLSFLKLCISLYSIGKIAM